MSFSIPSESVSCGCYPHPIQIYWFGTNQVPMASALRATLWATLTTTAIIGIELTVFAAIASIPAPIPGFSTSMPVVVSMSIVCVVLLRAIPVSSTPPATDMREEYGLPEEYHWPIDER